MIPKQEYNIDFKNENVKDEFHNPNSKYFQEALSDFMYDAASGRAIRHLCDAGYTAAQIMRQLDYPTPFSKVQHTITRHLKETGVLLEQLPILCSNFETIRFNRIQPETLFSFLTAQIKQDGEEHSYMSCPFTAAGQQTDTFQRACSMLTKREREYLEGIIWDVMPSYHRLNRRMLEIGVQIASCSKDIRFYFLISKKCYKIEHIQ